MIRQSLNHRHSVAESQIIRTSPSGGGSSSAYLRNMASAGTPDGLTIAYDANGLLGLNSSGATDGQTWVYDAVDGWELRTVPSGTGLANRMAKWTGTGTLSYGPLVTETGTIGLGVGVTSEPTDTFFYINVGETTDFAGIEIETLGTEPGNTDRPALVIASGSRAGGATITQTREGPPDGSFVTFPAPALTLRNTATQAAGLDIILDDGVDSSSYGARITTSAIGAATGLIVEDNGSAGAMLVTGTTRLRVPSGSTTTQPLIVSARSTTEVAAATIAAGKAEGLSIARASGMAGATASILSVTDGSNALPAAIITSTAGSGAALSVVKSTGSGRGMSVAHSGTAEAGYFVITNAANAAPAMYATTDGSGEAIEGVNSGTGMAGHLRITNGDSTADALKCETAGNGRAGYFYRNVASASADNVSIFCTNASDAGDALSIGHDGTGIGIDVRTTGDAQGIRIATASTTTNKASLYIDHDGTGPAINVLANTSVGYAISLVAANGGIGVVNGNAGTAIYADSTLGTGDAIAATAASGRGLYVTNSGAGATIQAANAGSGAALIAANNGTGTAAEISAVAGIAGSFTYSGAGSANAVIISSSNAGNTGTSLSVTQIGTGRAGFFTRGNASATSPVLYAASTAADGAYAIMANHSGTSGGAGYFITSSTSSTTATLYAESTCDSATGKAAHLVSSGTAAYAALIESTDTSNALVTAYIKQAGTGTALVLQQTNSTATTGRDFATCVGPGGGNVWRVDVTGKTFQNGGSQNSGADFAELRLLEDGCEAAPGDVLVWSERQEGRVRPADEAATGRVAGIYSTRPSYESLDIDDDDLMAHADEAIPLAVSGIVPCRVKGAVRVGDLLVATDDGRAVATKAPHPGSVIGKAIGASERGGVVRVQMLLS